MCGGGKQIKENNEMLHQGIEVCSNRERTYNSAPDITAVFVNQLDF